MQKLKGNNGKLLEQNRRRVGAACRRRREMIGERIEFIIIIIIANATVLPNALSRTIAFSMFRKHVGNSL